VFPSAIPGQPIQEPKRAWARVCKDAGIENAHIHDLRRTLATKQLQLGAPMAVIRDSLTQKDIRVTERAYAHVRSDAVRDSVSKAVSDLNEKR
jgi:integrase